MRYELLLSLVLAASAAAQEPPNEITVSDLPALAIVHGHHPTPPEDPVPIILPVSPLRIDGYGNLERVRPPRTYWFTAEGGFGQSLICDPFGKLDTECAISRGPVAIVETGASWWRVRFNGSALTTGPAKGWASIASLRASAFAIGPVRGGVVIEAEAMSWERSVYSTNQTTLGTQRNMRVVYLGFELGIGPYSGPHARLVLLPGYWSNDYYGILIVTGSSGRQGLARDQFSLARLRLEVVNIRAGSRVRLSGNVQHTRAYPIGRYRSISPLTPTTQWSVSTDTSARVWSPSPRFHLDAVLHTRLANRDGLLTDSNAVNIGFALRLR